MKSGKKVLILVPPLSGHLNPVCCIELNYKVIIFGTEKFKNDIEKIGAEYKEYLNFNIEINDLEYWFVGLYEGILNAASESLPIFFEFCQNEKPDLIICDNLSFHARYLYKFMENKYLASKLEFELPKLVIVYQSFAFIDYIYPTQKEYRILFGKINLRKVIWVYKMIFKNNKIFRKYDLNYPVKLRNTQAALDGEKNNLKLCCVLQEIQPKAKLFEDKIKFIGCCLNEKQADETENEKLTRMLDLFPPKNPILNQEYRFFQIKLVFISLGTVFNNQIEVFDKVLHAFLTYADLESLRIIISVGEQNFKIFQKRIETQKFKLPDNILILSRAPQISILKRASLFITHAGMNSANESIHYGVPLICLPISADQPLVAQRLCDELNLGIMLNPFKLSSDQLRVAVHEVLNNKIYLNNMLKYTNISLKTNGCLNACNIIKEFMTTKPIEVKAERRKFYFKILLGLVCFFILLASYLINNLL